VYTIGVGTEGYAPFPIKTDLGIIIQQQKVSIDEKLLKIIAEETGGKYFRAKDNASLESIYKEIDSLEKSKVEISTITRYSEKFFPFCNDRFRPCCCWKFYCDSLYSKNFHSTAPIF
jgi:Ca-activated chloride channel family protein